MKQMHLYYLLVSRLITQRDVVPAHSRYQRGSNMKRRKLF